MSHDDCRKIQELCDAQWDGDELSAQDRARVDAHLQQCSTCSATVEAMATLLTQAGELKTTHYERPLSVAPLVLHGTRRPAFFAWGMGLGWVTAALLLGLWLGHGTTPPTVEGKPGATLVRFVVPVTDAQRVEVVGDFTNWSEHIPLAAAAGGLWVGEVKLTPGRYNYVIIVDGERVLADPAAQRQVDDGFGGQNSVLEVEGSI
jgi:hypothetical protein